MCFRDHLISLKCNCLFERILNGVFPLGLLRQIIPGVKEKQSFLYTLVQPSGAILSTLKHQHRCEIDHIHITVYWKNGKKIHASNLFEMHQIN